jgi:hypothetical protein
MGECVIKFWNILRKLGLPICGCKRSACYQQSNLGRPQIFQPFLDFFKISKTLVMSSKRLGETFEGECEPENFCSF